MSIIKNTFPVIGMTCASCAGSVESILSHLEGVSNANVNLANNTVYIEYDSRVTREQLKEALVAVGYDLIIEDTIDNEKIEDEKLLRIKQRLIGSALFTTPIFIIGMFYMHWEPGKWISLILSLPVLFYFGNSFYINAFKQARHRKANMDTLVALSTSVAFLFSLFNTFFPNYWLTIGIEPHVYYEAATVIITFISFGKYLEEKAKSGTTQAIKKLMGLQPKTVKLLIGDKEVERKIEEVVKGDIIQIKPGEKIPLDGKVIDGSSYVNESMISGEPIPVIKMKDSKVFAGTINQKGSFRFIVEKVSKETVLAHIIDMVQKAQGSKAPVQKLVDKIAGIFVPVVMGISLITFIVWLSIGGFNHFSHALLSAITVLVIACPCALGLATPTAIMVGIGKGAENSILVKDAESLEIGLKVDTVILDKTGTITEGKPKVTEIKWLINKQEELTNILYSIESESEHPLAVAVTKYLVESHKVNKISFKNFESVTGKGAKAITNDDQLYLIGNQKLLNEHDVEINDEIRKTASDWQLSAATVVYFANKKDVIALIAIRDTIKKSSKQAITKLKNEGIEVIMMTGDNLNTAKSVSNDVGINTYYAEMLPGDKAEKLKHLQSKGHVVAMVGDGINDSQALAQSDLSIAMGHGSDIALDVAKMALITSDLSCIPKAIHLSRLTVNGIRQNLFWAFIYNIIGIPIAAGVLYPVNGFLLDPMIAGAAMAFSSVSVVLNSLRLKFVRL
ncbi:MAG: heavy metal translocating P-type ATPase [Bacteroidia bacterium]